ncbi:hypothetical protein [Listeria marthii]|uniref:hypothetical protein n=1 Tax=Listeria marthii TaxID=529731 RepID=UPI0016254456|nr:hypothetical protein [Listeria marthii]MBC2011964.1 hypothetical protein [Listeria marthii]MBC2039683.1 hypothetical protein [Listeria marthii]MBF2488425.1 hypothetical protein [Listeria marthii]
MYLAISINNFCRYTNYFRIKYKKAMENGKKVTLYLCGGEYINKNQREILNSIMELLKKSENGEVLSLNKYFPQSIIIDSNSGVLYSPSIASAYVASVKKTLDSAGLIDIGLGLGTAAMRYTPLLAEQIEKLRLAKVGRWMSVDEFEKMLETGKV